MTPAKKQSIINVFKTSEVETAEAKLSGLKGLRKFKENLEEFYGECHKEIPVSIYAVISEEISAEIIKNYYKKITGLCSYTCRVFWRNP